ncbi:unnamed protein product [Spirodela intermedia]|uniref:Uncharacterized protein n=1 Tax=Spirodela intermedia TaxID=51605 RepID=A0A7I8LFY4_SPIIN|nr:unnamed protein product [Spirodela intermedia]
MESKKVVVIDEWLMPKGVFKLKLLLRFINYYKKLIKNFSQLAVPLM